MKKSKWYALILIMAMLTQTIIPSANVLAEDVNTKNVDEKVTLEEGNVKINESLEKTNEIIKIPDINLKRVLNKTLNQAEDADITKEQLESITELLASDKNNNVNSLEGLQYCLKLEVLDMSNGQIVDISPLKDLSNLEVLILYGNQISNIEGLKYLKNLKVLDLGFNQISKIEGLEELNNIEDLNLSRNEINMINGISHLYKLRALDLSNNNISKIEGIEGLSNLKMVYMPYNNIEKIEGLTGLNSLDTLQLSSNKISKIEGLEGLNSLNSLFLGFNEIEKITGLSKLISLYYLQLEGNKISNIEPLKVLTQLGIFNISNQKIQLSEVEGNSSVNVNNILVGLNGENIEPNGISSGGTYNLDINKITWNNVSKDVVENYSFTKDIVIGDANGNFSGTVSQPIKYVNNNQGNTDNNSNNEKNNSSSNNDNNSNNGKSDIKNTTSYANLPQTGVESPLPYIAGVSLLLGTILIIKKKNKIRD